MATRTQVALEVADLENSTEAEQGYSSAIGYAGDGAVRIIWGSGRAYPNTNTADV